MPHEPKKILCKFDKLLVYSYLIMTCPICMDKKRRNIPCGLLYLETEINFLNIKKFSIMSYKNIPRLYINKELISNKEIDLVAKDHHYIKNVLRLKVKEKIRIFNGKEGEWEALIISNDSKKVKCIKNKETSF